MVVQGPVPQPDGSGTALRPLRLHPHRRHFPEYGRQPGGGGHHPGHPQVEDHAAHHPAYGEARHSLHHPAGLRLRHGLLPGAPLPGPQHPVHQVCVHELQVHGRSQHPGHYHDDLRRGHYAAEPDLPEQPEELHHRYRQVRPDLQDHPGQVRQIHHRHHPGDPDLLHQHFPHYLLRL